MTDQERTEKIGDILWSLYPEDSPAAHSERLKQHQQKRSRMKKRSRKMPLHIERMYNQTNQRRAAEKYGLELATGNQIQYR